MRVLLAVLLVGIAGCGGEDTSPGDVAVPTPKSSQAKTDKSPAQTADADPVAALKKIGAKIKRDDQGEVVEVSLRHVFTVHRLRLWRTCLRVLGFHRGNRRRRRGRNIAG